jgi:hypothetical protein
MSTSGEDSVDSVDPWQLFYEGVDELSDDFMEVREQPPMQQRDWVFERPMIRCPETCVTAG